MANIKILVAYFKPAPLFDGDVLLPIHAGRSCRDPSTKDGPQPASDRAWLQEHMIGDDTGDHLSEHNRDINEWSVIHWAYHNYRTALGDPEIIGLMHYSRLLHLGAALKPVPDRTPATFEEALGLDGTTLQELCRHYDLVTSPGQQLRDAHDHHAPPQPPQPLSETYHPRLYRQCLRYQQELRFYPHNIFIMRRELFLEYARECLPLLHDLLQLGPDGRMRGFGDWLRQDPRPERARRRLHRLQQHRDYYPRLTSYTMELISSYFFMSVMERSPQRVLRAPVFNPARSLCALQPPWRVQTRRTLVRLLSNVYVSRDRRHRFRDYHSPAAALLRRLGQEGTKELLRQAALRQAAQ